MIFLGLVLSFFFVFAVLGLGIFLFRRGLVDSFTSRKIIHIGVSHWWLFHMYLIRDPWWGLIGPIFFVGFNLMARQIGFLKAMEPGRGESNLGTIYFPISLIVMVVLSGWMGMPLWIAGFGVLVLGWGDGLAALAGKKLGTRKLPVSWSHKTWVGTFTLILASLLVYAAFSHGFNPGDVPLMVLSKGLAIAVTLALVEALTPFGIDNLLLPLAASFMAWGLA